MSSLLSVRRRTTDDPRGISRTRHGLQRTVDATPPSALSGPHQALPALPGSESMAPRQITCGISWGAHVDAITEPSEHRHRAHRRPADRFDEADAGRLVAHPPTGGALPERDGTHVAVLPVAGQHPDRPVRAPHPGLQQRLARRRLGEVPRTRPGGTHLGRGAARHRLRDRHVRQVPQRQLPDRGSCWLHAAGLGPDGHLRHQAELLRLPAQRRVTSTGQDRPTTRPTCSARMRSTSSAASRPSTATVHLLRSGRAAPAVQPGAASRRRLGGEATAPQRPIRDRERQDQAAVGPQPPSGPAEDDRRRDRQRARGTHVDRRGRGGPRAGTDRHRPDSATRCSSS